MAGNSFSVTRSLPEREENGAKDVQAIPRNTRDILATIFNIKSTYGQIFDLEATFIFFDPSNLVEKNLRNTFRPEVL